MYTVHLYCEWHFRTTGHTRLKGCEGVTANKFSSGKEQASGDYYVLNVDTMELHTSDIFHLEAVREAEVVRLSKKLLSYV